MELINPDGSKLEPRRECAHKNLDILEKSATCKDCGHTEIPKPAFDAEKAPEAEAATEPEPPLKLDFNRVGWMRIEVNLEAMSHQQATVDQYGGFMERVKAQGFKIIAKMAGQREELMAALAKENDDLMKQQNKNGFRNFVSRFRRK